MNKTKKLRLISALAFMLLGVIIFVCTMTVLRWDFSKLSTKELQTNEYEISESFNDILIETDTADIFFAVSTDGKCKVQCYEYEKEKHTVSVQNGTLSIKLEDNRSWRDYVAVSFSSTKVKIYLPEGVQPTITLQVSTGDVYARGITADVFSISLSTGDVEMQNVSCNQLISTGSTGDVELTNVICNEKLTIKRSSGDVELKGCDAGEILIKTSTGDIEGSLLSAKVFIVDTKTGDKRVPSTTSGGRCEITTKTGDIEITIRNP